MEDTQLLKGILEGCILAIIEEHETYGYDILSQLQEYGFENIIEGTLYPVLTRLNKKKLISCRMGESPLGPKRKYYSLTDDGQAYLKEFIKCWTEVQSSVNRILKKEG